MLVGRYAAGHPRIDLEVGGHRFEFIVDTGFRGDLTLPPSEAQTRCGPVSGYRVHALADGNLRTVAVHLAVLDWAGGRRECVVLALGEQPLLGTGLLEGNHLHVEAEEGGEVLIETL